MSGSHIKVQDEPCTPEQFAGSLEKLHDLLREEGVTTAIVITSDGKDRVTAACVGAPLDIMTVAINGTTQVYNLARRNVTIKEG